MHLFADKPLPEPENDAPDWTYEELIDAFVVDMAARWLEHKRRHAARGIIEPDSFDFRCLLIVELRGPLLESSAYLTRDQFHDLYEYRYWFVDKDGFREVDHTTYRAISSDEVLTNTMGFEREKFCFENGFRSMLSSVSGVGGAYRFTRNQIARGEDGEIYVAERQILALS